MTLRSAWPFFAIAALAGCATSGQALKYCKPTVSELPPLGELVLPGEVLEALIVRVDCVGFADIANVPDLWTARIEPDREHSRVILNPAPHLSAKATFLARPPAVGVLLRGQ